MGTIEPHFPFGIGVLSPGPLLFSCVPREGLVAVGTNFVGFECGWKRFVFPRRRRRAIAPPVRALRQLRRSAQIMMPWTRAVSSFSEGSLGLSLVQACLPLVVGVIPRQWGGGLEKWRSGGGCRKRIREKKRRLDDTSNGVKLMKYTHPTFLLLGDFNTGTV